MAGKGTHNLTAAAEAAELGPLFSRIHSAYSWLFYDISGGDPVVLFNWALQIWSFVFFWGVGGLYLMADLDFVKFAQKYKIQPKVNNPLPSNLLHKLLRRTLANWVFINVPFTIGFGYLVLNVRGNPYLPEDIYTDPIRLAMDIICIAMCEEFLFYWSHRIMHEVAVLYKNIHKIHHEFTAPVAISAIYAHPIEHIISNVGPIALGPLVCGCHVWLIFLWVTVALFATLVGHSGYHFPFMKSNEKHDFHHARFKDNYGPLHLFDGLCETDKRFKEDIASKRDFTSWTLTPMREIVPDPKGAAKEE